MKILKQKKGQLSLENAPVIVALVGLTFLVMATLALIGEKYGSSIDATDTYRVNNETIYNLTAVGNTTTGTKACNFKDFSVLYVINASATGGEVLTSPNYTTTAAGIIKSAGNGQYNNTAVKVTYTYSYTGVACNVTTELQENLSDNTSIAGIVLVVSLVGIVLSVLVGVFLGLRSRRV